MLCACGYGIVGLDFARIAVLRFACLATERGIVLGVEALLALMLAGKKVSHGRCVETRLE